MTALAIGLGWLTITALIVAALAGAGRERAEREAAHLRQGAAAHERRCAARIALLRQERDSAIAYAHTMSAQRAFMQRRLARATRPHDIGGRS